MKLVNNDIIFVQKGSKIRPNNFLNNIARNVINNIFCIFCLEKDADEKPSNIKDLK